MSVVAYLADTAYPGMGADSLCPQRFADTNSFHCTSPCSKLQAVAEKLCIRDKSYNLLKRAVVLLAELTVCLHLAGGHHGPFPYAVPVLPRKLRQHNSSLHDRKSKI